ncbi:hypothetical protein PUN28_014016 [Cardiocondyla obscurior]|uniref:Uncharacterized protein n=1 Tax=Cardiocondyla obscurior TaxID=286306 RepID=A0AAW2F5L1_9HYME
MVIDGHRRLHKELLLVCDDDEIHRLLPMETDSRSRPQGNPSLARDSDENHRLLPMALGDRQLQLILDYLFLGSFCAAVANFIKESLNFFVRNRPSALIRSPWQGKNRLHSIFRLS